MYHLPARGILPRVSDHHDQSAHPPALFTIAVVVIGVGLNLSLSLLNEWASLPFFMDTIGTAVAAVTVGLVPALIVAVGTNASFELVYGMDFEHLPFAICGIATVLILRAFLARGYFRNTGHTLIASLAVALANALLGGIIAAFLFQGVTGVGIDYLVAGLVASGQSILSASFWARVPANIVDKTIAVFIAYFTRDYLLALSGRLRVRLS